MDEVAKLPAADRRDLFVATAASRGVRPELIEKDFWVCWLLKRLYLLDGSPTGLIFKGGTSLSKVYRAIDRFSEDVDLSIDRAVLGYGGTDELAALSGKKRRETLDKLKADCVTLIRDRFVPDLASAVGIELGSDSEAGWSIEIDPGDMQAVRFRYPPSLGTTVGAAQYIQSAVLLELGARGDQWPATSGEVRPYAAEAFPSAFKAPACTVRVLSAERTFWEKATLLHRWHHRDDRLMDERQSRHYYDVVQLYKRGPGRAALADPELLKAVARYKSVFYEEPRARYDLAVPGSLRLLPNETHRELLEADYKAMGEMIFGEPPTWDFILHGIAEIEDAVNKA